MNARKANRLPVMKLLACVLLLALCAALTLVYLTFSAKPVSGSKQITLTVVNSRAESTEYRLRTDAQFLSEAMDEAEGLTYSGTEGPYGLMIDTVNGETADFSVDGAYWSFTVNGEYGNYGVDEQPVYDGDAFAIVYTR